jgi:hypothetical protein
VYTSVYELIKWSLVKQWIGWNPGCFLALLRNAELTVRGGEGDQLGALLTGEFPHSPTFTIPYKTSGAEWSFSGPLKRWTIAPWCPSRHLYVGNRQFQFRHTKRDRHCKDFHFM